MSNILHYDLMGFLLPLTHDRHSMEYLQGFGYGFTGVDVVT
jgi:hypothetical protein